MQNIKTIYNNSNLKDRFEFIVPLLFILALYSGLILQNTKAPLIGAYGVTVVAYFIGTIIFIIYSNSKILALKWHFLLFFAISTVALVNYLYYPVTFNLKRLLTLFVILPANFYIVSSIVTLRQFFYTTSRIGMILVGVGLLPLIGLPTQFGIFDLSVWGHFSEFKIPIITSVFVNPNQLGFFTLVGAISAFGEQRITKSRASKIVLWINTLGLMLSHYRTGWVALLLALGLWYVFVLGGRDWLLFATVGGITSIGVGLALLFGILPGPDFLSEMSLNGRRELWITSVRAFQEKVFVGHGFLGTLEAVGNPHNSYLRMFVSFGIIGGFLYTLLVISVTVGSARRTISNETWTLTALLVAVLLIQLFNQLTFIGISMRSSMIAIIMGYYMLGRHQPQMSIHVDSSYYLYPRS
jgi:O-antigen ligase